MASFYALVLTQTFSLIGSRMTSVAIGLVQVVTGLVLLAGAALTFSLRSVRRLEAELPDYQAEIAGEK